MAGFYNLNFEEKKAIEELKTRIYNDLTPAMHEDPTVYYRFLKARDFDLDKAEKMLRKHIVWRKTFQYDTILQNFKPTEFFGKYVDPSFIGFDKEGDIVLYSPAGTFDIQEIYKSVKMNNFMKHWLYFAEKNITKMTENNKKTGSYRYQATLIFDCDKLTWKQLSSKLTINLFIRFLHLYQDNLPERSKYIYIINAPRYLIYFLSVLKSVIAEATAAKFRLFYNDDWKESLLEFIDASVLPAFLGGKKTDPDGNPLCRSFIVPGGKIPEKYFLYEEDRYFQSNTQVKKIIVYSRNKAEINVDVEEAGHLVEWEFFVVQNKDIAFGLFYENSAKVRQEVIPLMTYDTSDGTEKDSYKCERPGTYIIIFDNSYSWLSAKTVEYSINVAKATVYAICKF